MRRVSAQARDRDLRLLRWERGIASTAGIPLELATRLAEEVNLLTPLAEAELVLLLRR